MFFKALHIPFSVLMLYSYYCTRNIYKAIAQMEKICGHEKYSIVILTM